MKKLLFLAFLIAAIGAGHSVSAQEEANCASSATVTDKDPSGLNVRSKPAVSGKVVTALKRGADETLKVYVTGYSNGWVKIGGAYINNGNGTISDKAGWVSAKMLAVTAGDNAQLYLKPNGESKAVTTVPPGTILQISGYDCGSFKVVYQGKSGWLKSMAE